jgi:beta-xylosidase
LATLSLLRAATPYTNPVLDAPGAADPTVILHNGTYYLYPTLDSRGYDVFVSADLVHWEKKGKCFEDARGGVWAPDVYRHTPGDGRFYLYYTVNDPDRPRGGKLIGVAVAESPLGPFKNHSTLVTGAIDAHLFRDDDKKLYLYYAHIAGGFRLMAQRMTDPVTKEGEPRELLRPSDSWEKTHGQVTEGPWMLKHRGLYYLMYSGSGADGPDYAIGYATADSPMGPFARHAGNPIAKRGGGIFGPGHHCVIAGPDRRLWMVYHQKEDDQVNWKRFVAIDPLWFDNQGVIHVKTTRNTPQPGP